MQSVVIPGDHTSPVRISLGEAFTEFTADGTDFDAVGVDLVGGLTYRITLDPMDSTLISKSDPFLARVLDSGGAVVSAGDDDSGSGTASVLIFTPATSGTYFMVVGPLGPNDAGGWWTLEVNELIPPADDFSNVLDPSNPLVLGDVLGGVVNTPGDTDTIAISLTAGVATDITVFSNDGGVFGESADVEIISFLDSSGVAVDPATYSTAHSQATFTSGGNGDAEQVTITPSSSGIFYITVGGGAGEVGDYSVSVAAQDRSVFSIRANEAFVASGNLEADIFFLGAIDQTVGAIFSDRNGDGVTTLTYSLPGLSPGFSPLAHNVVYSEWTVGYEPASGVVLDAYGDIISSIEQFAMIDFVEVADSGQQAGTFRIGNTDISLGSASGTLVTGWSGFPGWMTAGETWINTDKGAENVQIIQNFGATGADLDNFLYNRTLHEFTHNLGLNHPDQSSLAGGVDPVFLGTEFSVVSRTASGRVPDAVVGDLFPQTLMWGDIQAIQIAYGKNLTTTVGANQFVFDTSLRHYATIWDAGGVDTLITTGVRAVSLNLEPGTWQDVGTTINYYGSAGTVIAQVGDTVFIAPDTTIENAQTGGGGDSVLGNAIANTISTGGGRDFVEGLGGNDTIDGGADQDTLDGGEGDDLILSQSGRDLVFGGLGDDSIDAAAGDDTVDGGANNDRIFGGAGIDDLSGGNGNDTIQGGDDGDTLNGGKGFDFLLGQEGHDFIRGDQLSDTLKGGAGRDTLFGGDDNDLIFGDEQADLIFGEAGDDNLQAGTGDDTVDGGTQRDSVFGGSGDDLIEGGGGNDTLTGGTGADTLTGGGGFDILQGDDGDDVLNGGGSNDILFGNAGNDTFIFEVGGAVDTLRDFTAGAGSEDVISLVGFRAAFDTFAEVIAAATDDGLHTTIDLGNGDMLVLRKVLVTDLHADDFTFG